MVLKKHIPSLSPNRKVKGNTLLEVLMSLSIISLVFLLGMGLLQQITGISSPVQRFRTRAIMQRELERTDFTFIPLEEEMEVQGRKLHRSISWINKKQEIVEIQVSCFWGEREIENRKKIINLKNLQL